MLLDLIAVEIEEPATDHPKEEWVKLRTDIEQCDLKPKAKAAPKADGEQRAKSGRKLSDYQIFLGNCMRGEAKGGRGLPMRECIDEWKAQKS
jgi:hypothetical protein